MAGHGSPAGQDAGNGSGWLEWARAAVVAGVRSHCALLELEIYEQVSSRASDLMLDGDTEHQARVRASIAAIVKYCLDAIEQGVAQTRAIPQAVLGRARATAREGASVGPLLRAIEAGYQPFVTFMVAEAEKLPDSALVRKHLRETYGGLLGDLMAAVDREYERERTACPPPLKSYGAAYRSGMGLALTSREHEVLELLLAERSYKQIAQALCVTPDTVHTHASHVYRKLGVKGRSSLTRHQR
jgi:DNA-binding CsgD family transcriptional regulator